MRSTHKGTARIGELADGINLFSYDTKAAFASYWHQVQEVARTHATAVLEVGVGTGFASHYLARQGIDVSTVDTDLRLNPDVVGTVVSLPLRDRCVETVTCFEVLEHLPYEQFRPALAELHRVSRKWVILSLPDNKRAFRLAAVIPKFGWFRWWLPSPTLGRQRFIDKDHHWEINMPGYPLKRIKDDLARSRFELLKTYRVFENAYHRFFLLEKR